MKLTTNNKYGEVVAFHGPVCGTCHQRMVVTLPRGTAKDGSNVCFHCLNRKGGK